MGKLMDKLIKKAIRLLIKIRTGIDCTECVRGGTSTCNGICRECNGNYFEQRQCWYDGDWY